MFDSLSELIEKIHLGEDSTIEFKRQLPRRDSLADEIAAFANARGGVILNYLRRKIPAASPGTVTPRLALLATKCHNLTIWISTSHWPSTTPYVRGSSLKTRN